MTSMDPENFPPETADSQTILNKIVLDYLKEQKSKRRQKWFKIILFLILIVFFISMTLIHVKEDVTAKSNPHVGLINIKGTIFDTSEANSDDFSEGMKKAFKNTAMKALILRIDSPGGSPVQADYMYNTIQYYHKKFPDIKIYAVCVDLCASAAYYIAASADAIYANPSSLVGSIGVIYNGFGFVDTLQKLGVSRRLQTAGKNKAFLDQFSPEVPEQKAFLQTMLNLIHQQFIDKVKKGRGKRLKINDEIFSGLIWTGIQAKELGLIDGFASSGQLARDVINIDKIIDYTYKKDIWERVSHNIGSAMAHELPLALGLKPGIQ